MNDINAGIYITYSDITSDVQTFNSRASETSLACPRLPCRRIRHGGHGESVQPKMALAELG